MKLKNVLYISIIALILFNAYNQKGKRCIIKKKNNEDQV